MVLAVVALHLDVDHREAVHATVGHGVLDRPSARRGCTAGGWRRRRWSRRRRSPRRGRAGSTRRLATAYWPCPPVCFLTLPSASALAGDRLPVGHPDVFGVDVDAELAGQPLERDGQVGLADAAEQRLAGLLVALDDQRRILGLEALQRAAELVVVGLGAGAHGDGEHGRRRQGRPRPARATPSAPACRRCGCAASLATAAMSPATSEVAGVCSLPRRWNRPCSRSSVPLVALTRWSSVLMVPDRTLNSESWPTNGSAIVRNTKASGWPAASAATVDLLVAGLDGDGPVSGRRTDLADEVGEAVDADARERRAEQRRGTPLPSSTSWASALLELLDRRDLAGQVALELLVVAGDDLLDELVVDAVLLVLELGRHRLGVVLAVGLVLEGLVREQVGDAVEGRLLADGQLERREARSRTWSRSWSSTRWKSARSLSSLLTKTMRGRPSSAHRRQTTSVCTSTPSTALTTKTARSATLRAASTSPMKSA